MPDAAFDRNDLYARDVPVHLGSAPLPDRIMPPTVATPSTLAMIRAAEARGVDTHEILAAAGLSRAIVEDPDERIPAQSALALWEELRTRAGDAALQLDAPSTLPFGAYRVIDYIVGASATVGDGVRRFADYFCLIADGRSLVVREEEGEHRLVYALADGRAAPGVFVDYLFAALIIRIRMKIRTAIRVQRVELRHAAPADPAPYAACFRAPVIFDATADRLVFDDEEWHAPMDHPDEALAHVLEQHARMLAAKRTGATDETDDFVRDVRRAVTAALPEEANAAAVAKQLCVSVRTLQRKLDAAGTTFRDVCDDARRALAEGYLTDPAVSIAEVAFLLGFSDQTSFHRAFRRWTGAAPGVWRSRAARRTGFSPILST